MKGPTTYTDEELLVKMQGNDEAAFREIGGSTTVNPMSYELAARCYSLASDFVNAITLQQKAVDVAREGLKAGRFVGVIHDYTLTEYEQKLKEYQAKSSK